MSENVRYNSLDPVRNEAIWQHTRVIFLVAGLFLLLNLGLGFANALTTGPLPRWQTLTHLHAGALGWITLSTIGLAIWLFTGARTVGDGLVQVTRLLGWLSLLAFAAYVLSIAIAFSQGGDSFLLLPIFGSGAAVMIWAAAIYGVTQLRHQPILTTVHLLLAVGLVVVAIGATMGVLIGLNYATGVGIATIQAHAPPMLFYLFFVAGAIIEWVTSSEAGRWSRSGVAQAAVLFVGAVIPPIAFLFDLMFLAPLLLVMLALFLVIFLARVGWRALTQEPFQDMVSAWIFFGTVWLVVVVILFPLELVLQPNPPPWLLPLLTHAGFVGMSTNLLLGVLSVRSAGVRRYVRGVESGSMWLLNLGLVVFFVLKIAIDTRLGAVVMGLGVLFAVGVMLYRLLYRTEPQQTNLA